MLRAAPRTNGEALIQLGLLINLYITRLQIYVIIEIQALVRNCKFSSSLANFSIFTSFILYIVCAAITALYTRRPLINIPTDLTSCESSSQDST